MRPAIELEEIRDEEKSHVVKVYRRYYRGKWYESETPQPNYDIISYYVTKVKSRLYYSTEYEAQTRADQYNERLRAYKRGLGQPIPDEIDWYDFNGTALHDPHTWWHDSGSWLYAHGYVDWSVEDLLSDESDVTFPYDDYDHTTVDFFKVLFTTKKYMNYEIKIDSVTGKYDIFEKK